MSQISAPIHLAPPSLLNNSLFLVYAPPDEQDFLRNIMEWKKVNPIDVSNLDAYEVISSRVGKIDTTMGTKPDGLIYFCEVWSWKDKLALTKLRWDFSDLAIVVILGRHYYIKPAQRSIYALGCSLILKSKIKEKADIVNLFS